MSRPVRLAISGSSPACFQACALGRGAPVLPDDRACDRLAGVAIPEDDGFPLIGDTDCRDVRRRGARLGQHSRDGFRLAGPDLARIVLDPAGLRKILREFPLRDGDCVAGLVEQDGARAGRALIERQDVSRHVTFSLRARRRAALRHPAGRCRPSLLRRHRMSSRGARPFLSAKVVDLAREEPRQHFFAQILSAADQTLDARAVGARVARAQRGRQPRIAALHSSQERCEARGLRAAAQAAVRQDRRPAGMLLWSTACRASRAGASSLSTAVSASLRYVVIFPPNTESSGNGRSSNSSE